MKASHVTHDAWLESTKKMPWNRTVQKQTLEKRDQAKQNGSLYRIAKIGQLAQQKTDSNVRPSPKNLHQHCKRTSMGIRSRNLIVMMTAWGWEKPAGQKLPMFCIQTSHGVPPLGVGETCPKRECPAACLQIRHALWFPSFASHEEALSNCKQNWKTPLHKKDLPPRHEGATCHTWCLTRIYQENAMKSNCSKTNSWEARPSQAKWQPVLESKDRSPSATKNW